MQAQAMRPHTSRQKLEVRREDAQPGNGVPHWPDEETEPIEASPETDETDVDECDPEDVDDDRWDVFILDDDGEPLPESGDFWFPD